MASDVDPTTTTTTTGATTTSTTPSTTLHCHSQVEARLEKVPWFHRLAVTLWHGGSAYDAWFTASTTQIAQVLLTFPYSFAQMGLASGIAFQVLYGVIGCWACYSITCLYADYKARISQRNVAPQKKNHLNQWFEVLGELLGPWWRALALVFTTTYLFTGATIQLIACGSNVYYINDKLDKRTWTYIFGACCSLTIFIPAVRNYRLWSFLGITMTSFTAWYMVIAALVHGQDRGVKHTGPHNYVQYFTGATNMLYAFGGHSVTVEIMDSMWKPQKFKLVYIYVILYILTLSLPSATAVYWAFGDSMIHNPNVFGVLPRTKFRDTAVVLMLIHQFIEFGLIALPIYAMWEKLLKVHHSSYTVKLLARLPVVLCMCFLAVMVPFFGPVNSTVGALLVSFSVYIIPCAAHMTYYWNAHARKRAVEQLPEWIGVADNVLRQLWRGGVGVCRRKLHRSVGEHSQLCQQRAFIWFVRQVLSVSSGAQERWKNSQTQTNLNFRQQKQKQQ